MTSFHLSFPHSCIPAGLLHTLPQRVTAFSVCPLPVPLPGSAGAVAAVAAATAAGTVEVVTVQQGALLPLHLSVGASLAVHLAPVQVIVEL